jgi:trimethylamine--corrinoid protein Co-methyltransferase
VSYYGRGRGLEYLDREELLNWHHRSLRVLEEVGVQINYEPALKLLESAGCDVSRSQGIVRVPQQIVERAIDLAPGRFVLGGRDPSRDLYVGGNDVHVTAGGSCVNIIDFLSGEQRPATYRDLEDIVRLQDCLEHLEACPSPVSPNDVPKNGLYIKVFEGMVKNTGKHLINQAESGVEVADHIDILEAAVGSREEVIHRNLVSFVCCFKSPLIYGGTNCEVLFECANHGLPVLVETDPISGATAPVTLSGLLVQQNAELLFAITLVQLVRPGAPVLYTNAPTVMDMRTGDVSEGCPERSLFYIYCAQICRFYDIPSCSVAGVTDSKINDIQSGIEKASTLLTTALAGYNLNYDAAGSINSVLTTSLEGMVIDNEFYGYIQRILGGVDFTSDTVEDSIKVIERIAHSGKSFLTDRHTKQNLRKEHWVPDVTDRRRYEVFEQSDEKGIVDRAKHRVKQILDSHVPLPLPAGASEKIAEIVGRAQSR